MAASNDKKNDNSVYIVYKCAVKHNVIVLCLKCLFRCVVCFGRGMWYSPSNMSDCSSLLHPLMVDMGNALLLFMGTRVNVQWCFGVGPAFLVLD